MHIDNLARAVELQAELKLWRDAESRCGSGVFKEAMLRVVDSAHGHQGQVADTQIKIAADHLRPFIRSQIERVLSELRDLGVDL